MVAPQDPRALAAEVLRLQEAVEQQEERLAQLTRRKDEVLEQAWYWQTRCLASEYFADIAAAQPISLDQHAKYVEILHQRLDALVSQVSPATAIDLAPQITALQALLQAQTDLMAAATGPEAADADRAAAQPAGSAPDLALDPTGALAAGTATDASLASGGVAQASAGTALPEGDDTTGWLLWEGAGHFYLQTRNRAFPIPPATVATVRALPGDILRVTVSLSAENGCCSAYPYYFLEEAVERERELTYMVNDWQVKTRHGDLPVFAPRSLPPAGTPVAVLYNPDLPVCALLDRVFAYAEEAQPESRAQSKASRTAPAARSGPTTAVEPQLTGRAICVLGGEGFTSYYRSVVERYGATLEHPGGFADLRRIEGAVTRSDAVVFITRGISHKVFEFARERLRGKPSFFCNGLGARQLEAVLVSQVIPVLAPEKLSEEIQVG